jgi:hypothetical protein
MNIKSTFALPTSMAVIALATMCAPLAHAGCGLYSPVHTAEVAGSHKLALLPFEAANAVADVDEASTADPSVVGTWKERWISEGSKGIPDGTEVDAGYAQWHSDGTEINVSGLRTPMSGDVCLGEWIKTGTRTYQMNHFGISYDPTGQDLVGPARIKQLLTISTNGKTTSGTFTIDQYDEENNLLAHVQGKLVGTRVDINTVEQPVE